MHETEGSFLEHYTNLLTDPAHLAYEITLILVIDVVLAGILWPLIKRAIKRHDRVVHGHQTEATGMEEW